MSEQTGDARRVASRRGKDGAPYRFCASVDVRFRDLDAFGHVNNAVYLTYLEIARAAYFTAVRGRPHGVDDFGIVVAEAACRYRSPAFYGERLVVEVATVGLRSRSLELRYRITVEGKGRVVAEASTVLVAFDHRAKRTAALDAAFFQAVEAFEGRPLRAR
jgi:acyl-CoA thioester hydrolase